MHGPNSCSFSLFLLCVSAQKTAKLKSKDRKQNIGLAGEGEKAVYKAVLELCVSKSHPSEISVIRFESQSLDLFSHLSVLTRLISSECWRLLFEWIYYVILKRTTCLV